MLERLLGSAVRAALLRTLCTDERRRVHLRELARANDLSAPCLMREAKNLVSVGVLKEEKDGNRVYYSANVACPFYDALKDLVAKTGSGEVMLRNAFAKSDAKVVFIYGSRAKGLARADSDYDVFVIGEEGLRKTIVRIAEVRDALGVEVNPYVITVDEYAKRRASEDHFLKDVIGGPKIFVKGDEHELEAMEG